MNSLFNSPQHIVISCSPFIIPWLKQETEALGFNVEAETNTTLEITGTFEDSIRLNLSLHTANHIFLLVKKFAAETMQQVYEGVKNISWEEIVPEDGYFSVHSFSDHPEVENTMYLNLRVKDAIADRFMEQIKKRPDSGSEKDKAVIFLFWRNNEASVYIDTTGEPLTKHGYRKISLRAPLQESLSAAIIMATKWDRNSTFINPMCGSGTLAIEAALLASRKPPGLIRTNFGFMHLKGYRSSVYEEMMGTIAEQVVKDLPFKIIAGDNEWSALNAAKTNAENAGVSHLIEFIRSDFTDTPVPPPPGVVIFNPPYGERLGSSGQLEITYASIGDFLKKQCKGYRGYVFTGNPELAKKIGLKAGRKTDFLNGQLKCKLLEYELYEGSKKKKDPVSK